MKSQQRPRRDGSRTGTAKVAKAASPKAASPKAGSPRSASSKAASGKSASSKSASGKSASGKSASGKSASGKSASGKSASGKPAPGKPAPGQITDGAGPSLNGAALGARLRAERERRGIGVRELARRVEVSPSLVSQIERGLVTPSVGTLWSMTGQLGLVMDGLFTATEQGDTAREREASSRAAPRRSSGIVQHSHDRQHIRLAGGVVWERLTSAADDEVEFLYVRYEVGAESCPENSFFRHGGKEYAYLLEGRLGLQIGFQRYELAPGDSVSFESHNPHRLWAIGSEPAVAIWVIVNRSNDNRKLRDGAGQQEGEGGP